MSGTMLKDFLKTMTLKKQHNQQLNNNQKVKDRLLQKKFQKNSEREISKTKKLHIKYVTMRKVVFILWF